MTHSEPDIAKVRAVILRYLRNNPHAGDSLEGVINWWLPQAYKKDDESRIKQVLEQLNVEGLVRKTVLVDGTSLYKQWKPESKD